MKTKVLFTAALMVAAASGAQAAPNAGSNMLVQLLESQRFEGVSLLADEDKVRPEQDNTDVTEWIVNPSFDENNTDGWTCGMELDASNGYIVVGSNPWSQPTFDFYQDIQVPNGLYSVSVQEHAVIGDKADLYIQGYERSTSKMNWNNGDLTAWEDKSVSRVSTAGVLVLDGIVRIGVNQHTGHSNQTLYFDNFQLTYVNDGLERVKELYAAAKNALQEKVNSDDYPEALDTRADGILDASVDENTDAYVSAYKNLLAMGSLFNSDAQRLKALQDQCQNELAEDGTEDEVKTAMSEALSASHTDLATANVSDLATIYDTLNAARTQYAMARGLSYVVEEYNFDDGRCDGWATTNCPFPGAEAGVMEYWNTNFDFWRSLTGLRSGWYQVEINAFYRSSSPSSSLADHEAGLDKNLAVVFGDNGGPGERYSIPALSLYDENCADIPGMGNEGAYPANRTQANNCFSAGHYKMVVNVYVDENGNMNYGLAGTNQGESWMCFDNFKVTYMGADLGAMYDAMKEQSIALANKYGLTKYAGQLEALQKPEVVDEATIWNLNEQTKAIIDIANAVTDLRSAIANVNVGDIDDLLANSTANQDLKNNLQTLYNTAVRLLTDATSVEEVQNVVNQNLLQVYRDYLSVANPVGDYQFDMTYLLTNPDVSGFGNVYVDGWYCEIPKGNFIVQNNTPLPGETGFNNYFECWSNDILQPGWAIFQKATLPVGSYRLEFVAFATKASNAAENVGTTPVVALYAGDKRGDEVASSVLAPVGVDFMQTTVGETYMGLKVEEGNTINWVGVNNMKLYKVAPKAVELTLDETEAYSVTSDTYANVTMTRSMQAKVDGADKWNTFCVPFDMTPEQLTANHISEVRTFNQVNVEGDAITLTSAVVNDGVKAGVPYLVKVDQDIETITVEGVNVTATAPTAQRIGFAGEGLGYVEMTGNYSAGTVPQGAYFINNNVFYLADEAASVSLKGFRAYITIVDEAGEAVPAGVNRLLIDIDGEVTAIEDVLGEAATDGGKLVDVYTLSGVKVKSGVKKAEALDGLQRGIYIVDGQKVIK